MGFADQLWNSIKLGIIVLLASRVAARLLTSSQLTSYIVAILTLLLFVWVLQERVSTFTVSEQFAQFEGLRDLVMSSSSLLITFFVFVIAAASSEWFQERFMNGPFVLELVFIVIMIIFILCVIGARFTQYHKPAARHVNHLEKISEAAINQIKKSTLTQ